jgi:hypothetical protein
VVRINSCGGKRLKQIIDGIEYSAWRGKRWLFFWKKTRYVKKHGASRNVFLSNECKDNSHPAF